MNEELLTLAEVAARLKLSRSHVYTLVASGELEAIRVTGGTAGRLRVDSQALANYLARIQPVETSVG